jgi:hypothetical protein
MATASAASRCARKAGDCCRRRGTRPPTAARPDFASAQTYRGASPTWDVGMRVRTSIRGMPALNQLAPSVRTLVPRIGTPADPDAAYLGTEVDTADRDDRYRQSSSQPPRAGQRFLTSRSCRSARAAYGRGTLRIQLSDRSLEQTGTKRLLGSSLMVRDRYRPRLPSSTRCDQAPSAAVVQPTVP